MTDRTYVENLEEITGELTLNFRLISHSDLFGTQPIKAEIYLCVDDTDLVFSLNNSFDPSSIELKILAWISKTTDSSRGVVTTARDCVSKLKRLNFTPLRQKGTSHLHFLRPDGTGKVTVPIHCGEIAKGTFNSILKQAGLDLRTYQLA